MNEQDIKFLNDQLLSVVKETLNFNNKRTKKQIQEQFITLLVDTLLKDLIKKIDFSQIQNQIIDRVNSCILESIDTEMFKENFIEGIVEEMPYKLGNSLADPITETVKTLFYNLKIPSSVPKQNISRKLKMRKK